MSKPKATAEVINKHGMVVRTDLRSDLVAEDVIQMWVGVVASSKRRQKKYNYRQVTGRPMRRLSLSVGKERNG